jgi:AI-2 transport protein TqsA
MRYAGGIATQEGGRAVVAATLPVIAVILVGWALRASYVVTMPLAFAFFLAVLVHPIQWHVAERAPARWRWLGTAAAMAVIVLGLAAAGGLIWFAVERVGGKAPQYADQLQGQWQALVGWARRNNLPVPDDMARSGGLGGRLGSFAAAAVTSVWQIAGFLALVFFFTLLMLVEASAWRDKVRTALDGGRARAVVDTVAVVAGKVRRFLLIRTVLGAISAVIAFVWLLVLGVDFAFLWGVLTLLLNYVPNVGSIIAAILPALFALIQHGWLWALLVIAGLAVTEQVIGNYVDPRLQGKSLDISPLVVLLSVIFWGWVWGVAGAVLAVPLTATIVIACAHIPTLRPVALLLSRSADERTLDEQTHR